MILTILAYLRRHPVAVTWGCALAAIAGAAWLLGTSEVDRAALIGTVIIAALMAISDVTGSSLEDGTSLTAIPALIIAGLPIAGWSMLLIATMAAALMAAPADRRTPARSLQQTGTRCLIIALSAPVYAYTHPLDAPAFSTPIALLGLVLIGVIIYGGEIISGAQNPDHDPFLLHWRERLGTLRWYVPVMVPLGALLGALWSVSPWAFLLGLTPLVSAQFSFRNQIALRHATTELRRTVRQRAELTSRLERLQALSTSLIGTHDTQQMLETLCERLAAMLDAPWGWVVLRDERQQPVLLATHNLPQPDSETMSGDLQTYHDIFRRGRVMLIADERCQELAPQHIAAAQHWTAVLSIPLLAEQQSLGAIFLAFDQLRGLDTDEQRILSAFARQAAMTLQSARLFNELSQKQSELVQSSKLAAVGTFAAGIAHEFNNLLGGMLGYAELGRSADDAEEKNSSFEVVIQACRRGRSITKGLLTFARRQEDKRTLADLTDAVDETLQLVELDLSKSRIKVVREIEPIPLTMCDVGQISQVVLNLITNARDAMRPKGGTLTIGLRERRQMIEISVSDTGHGIPEELRDKIFEPFMTTKGALGGSQTPGTGLGLSISYGIIRDHGGTIHVSSQTGHGTIMTIRLQIIAEEEEALLEEKALVV